MYRTLVRLLVLTLAFAGSSVGAQQLQEGRDYTLVRVPQAATSPGKIEVVEFFSYQCPHCAAFAPSLDQWSKKLPKDVLFSRESVAIGHAPWEPAARTYYTLLAMGKLEALDAQVFKAIHQDRVPFGDEPGITAWMVKKGLNGAEFKAAYTSFGVDSKFKRGDRLSRTLQVPSIPTLVIDGRYMMTIASNIDFDVQLAKVTALIDKARVEKQSRKE